MVVKRDEKWEERCVLDLGKDFEREYKGSPCGFGNGFHPIQDEDYKFVYCAPCQTIDYTCPDTREVLESRRVCPYDQTLQPRESIPPKADVYMEAQKEILDLYERNCEIKTRGYFRAALRGWRGEAPKGLVKGEVKVGCKTSERVLPVSIPRFDEESAEATAQRMGKAALQTAASGDCDSPVALEVAVEGTVTVSGNCKSGAIFLSNLYTTYFAVEPVVSK